jgi:hypothetical protein
MDREQLLRECVVITCFLENINTNNRDRMAKLLKGLNEYSTDRLKYYYEVNSHIKELRIDRILNENQEVEM